MKRILGMVAMVLCGGVLTQGVLAEGVSGSCMEKAITQGDMNQCEAVDFQVADAELNRVYKKIVETYADDPAFLEKMKLAQRAWITFRDAQLAMMYPPHPEDPAFYGSSQPMCDDSYKTRLTLERITTLKEWLTGATEGDMCSGSMKLTDLLLEAGQADQ